MESFPAAGFCIGSLLWVQYNLCSHGISQPRLPGIISCSPVLFFPQFLLSPCLREAVLQPVVKCVPHGCAEQRCCHSINRAVPVLFIVKSGLQKLKKGNSLVESNLLEVTLLLNRMSVPVEHGRSAPCSEAQRVCSDGKKGTSEALWREVESTTEKCRSVSCS